MSARKRARPDSPTRKAARAHDEAVDACLGDACRLAVASALDLRSASIDELERACNFLTDGGTRPSGAIRKWRKGHLPSVSTIRVLEVHTQGRIRLSSVLRDPLYELTRSTRPTKERIKVILRGLPMELRLDGFVDDSAGPELRWVPGRRDCQRLRDKGTRPAFVALLALARRAEYGDDESAHATAALAAYDLWPRVVADTSLRECNWTQLTECLHRVLWDHVYGGVRLETHLERLLETIAAVLANPEHQYPLLLGPTRSEWDELAAQVGQLWLQMAQLAGDGANATAAERRAVKAQEQALAACMRVREVRLRARRAQSQQQESDSE